MPKPLISQADKQPFIEKVIMTRHEHINPCFMTGKACVYADQIDEELKAREQSNKDSKPTWRGFAIMPFRPGLKVFYQNCLVPFFMQVYGDAEEGTAETGDALPNFLLETADQVTRPGIIICEGICKKIQEADFVVADVSTPNENVFYEMGLAYGIGHKIVVVHQRSAEFGKKCLDTYLRDAGCDPYAYDDLGLIEADKFRASERIWRYTQVDGSKARSEPRIVFLEMMRDGRPETTAPNSDSDPYDISLLFSTHVKSHVGLAMERIYRGLTSPKDKPPKMLGVYLDMIKQYLNRAEAIDPSKRFEEIRRFVNDSYCLVVRTGKSCHPMSYFWLGFAHARGKNVIPITVAEKYDSLDRPEIEDLAFDIRAQRHMVFEKKRPDLLEHHLEQTLREMVRVDFSEWSRKTFWKRILGSRGVISILTGALHSEDHKREMIGDWDLRAASELTSYLSRHRYHPKIETPIYQPEFAMKSAKMKKSDYTEYIQRIIDEIHLGEKNCVIIASPDVNPLTEIVLGRVYGIPDKELFTNKLGTECAAPDAAVVWKRRRVTSLSSSQEPAERVFYREEVGTEDQEQRGFACRSIRGGMTLNPYLSQEEAKDTAFKVFAHLVIALNPFSKGGQAGEPLRYVIVLNGVSGPATFALTHVLTGGSEEFVSYGDDFDPARKSEEILHKLLAPLHSQQFRALQCVLEVTVGPAAAPPSTGGSTGSPMRTSGATFDWRRILRWDLDRTIFNKEIVEIQ